jgi:S1-C subfamily serine protease
MAWFVLAPVAPAQERQDNERDRQDSRQNRDQSDNQNRQSAQDDEEVQYRGMEHAALGVLLSESSGQNGVRIRDILPESPAEQAGLREGDRITEIDGKQMRSYRDVIRFVNRVKPDQTAKISVERDGKEQTFKVAFAPREEVYGDQQQFAREGQQGRRNDQDRFNQQQYQPGQMQGQGRFTDQGRNANRAALGIDLENQHNAAIVRDVIPNSPAERAGLRSGDEITAIDNQRVRSQNDLAQELQDRQPGERVTLTIRRNDQQQTVRAQLISQNELAQQGGGQRQYQRGQFDSEGRQQADTRGRAGYQRWNINGHHPALGVNLEEDDQGKLSISRVIDKGPADQAGLRRGDEILAIDDHDVNSVRDVMQQLSHKQPRDQVTLAISRDGRKSDVKVTLGSSEDVFKQERTASRQNQGRDRDQDNDRNER